MKKWQWNAKLSSLESSIAVSASNVGHMGFSPISICIHICTNQFKSIDNFILVMLCKYVTSILMTRTKVWKKPSGHETSFSQCVFCPPSFYMSHCYLFRYSFPGPDLICLYCVGHVKITSKPNNYCKVEIKANLFTVLNIFGKIIGY